MSLRHFLAEDDLSADEFRQIVQNAIDLKANWRQGVVRDSLKNRVLAMIFEKASTRTRTSFEAGMAQLGGHAINLSTTDSQISRGEPITDTAKVLSEMVDAAMLRTYQHTTQQAFADAASIPTINGLSEYLHPCQLLADVQTCFERFGELAGSRVAWIGPGNNMCNSWLNTARLLDFQLAIACPAALMPDADLARRNRNWLDVCDSPESACKDAHVVVTDVWASMGEEDNSEQLHQLLQPYQVTEELMKQADADAIFLHCLPAHRGEEVAAGVIDGPQSAVWQEAGNRLHAQKALLEFLLT